MITFNEFANFKSVEVNFSALLLWNMKKGKKEIFFFFRHLIFLLVHFIYSSIFDFSYQCSE